MNFNDPEDDERDIDLDGGDDADLDPGGDEDAEGEEDDDAPGFDDDEDGEDDDGELPKRLRARINDQGHVIATLSRKLAETSAAARPTAIEVGERPTLEGCDYDEDRLRTETDAWIDRKIAASTTESAAPTTAEEEARQDVERYQASISKLTYADAGDVVGKAREALTPAQEFMISQASNEPGKLLYALGRHPEKLAELVRISNPAKFIVRVATLEANMKSGSNRRQAPQPERIPRGNAAARTGSVDQTEAKLEKEARRSGDRTELIKYRQKKAEKAS